MKIKNGASALFHSFLAKPVDFLLILVFVLATLKVISLYFDVENDEDDWETFKQDKKCNRPLGEDGYKSSTWECDDGKVHYLWRQQK